ncbi:hypothetical protein [Nonomuraea typhae]|uniref:Uncharacterized protein n=1 Tax=Nonomuraea typhae TaxID=2603600 RepID=A0ABW7YK19_9ACTN
MTHLPKMSRLAVGELFDPTKTSYMHLNDQVNLVLSTTGCMLLGYFAEPQPDEIAAWRGDLGPAKFGWVDADAVAFLVAQLGRDAPFVDSSFHPARLPEENRGLPRGDDQPPIDTIATLAATPLEWVTTVWIFSSSAPATPRSRVTTRRRAVTS